MGAFAKRKFVPGKSFYFASVMFILIGLAEGYEYSRAGSAPQSMTAMQAAALDPRSGKHWVHLTGLQLDCAKPVREMENDRVSRILYTATDETKKAVFVVDYDGACDTSAARAYDGMLEPSAGDYILREMSAAGVEVPPGDVPHLTVGDTPSSTLKLGFFFAGAGAAALVATWWSRKRLLGGS